MAEHSQRKPPKLIELLELTRDSLAKNLARQQTQNALKELANSA